MPNPSLKKCPCGKDKKLRECCGRFIGAAKFAKTPEQLMRSRFSAYALGGHGQYLLDTWYSLTSQGLSANDLSKPGVLYQSLEILKTSQSGDIGTVEFRAYFIDPDKNNEPGVLHEISKFKRDLGRWYYVDGLVS